MLCDSFHSVRPCVMHSTFTCFVYHLLGITGERLCSAMVRTTMNRYALTLHLRVVGTFAFIVGIRRFVPASVGIPLLP